jgi:hypothetical protein
MKKSLLPFSVALGLLCLHIDVHAQHTRIVAGQLTGMHHVQPANPILFACGPAGQCIELDVDGNGSNDVQLKAYNVGTGGSSGVYIVEILGTRPEIELAGTDSATWAPTDSRHAYAVPLALGDSVSARPLSSGRYVNWQVATSTAAARVSLLFSQLPSSGGAPYQTGYWRSAATRYVGLRMAQSTGGYRYGWLQTEMQGSTVSVVSYGFQTAITSSRSRRLSAVQLYPNPVERYLQLQLPAATAAHLEILDGLGRKLLTRELPASLSPIQAIDLSTLEPGVYTVHVRTTAGSVSQRLSKL